MGQYYNPTILGENGKTVKKFVFSHHITETLTRHDGSKYVGGHGLKLMEHSYIGNNFVKAVESLILNNPQRIVWAGDYAKPCKGMKSNVYHRCEETLEVIPIERPTLRETRYIVNHTTKQFVDKNKCPKSNGWRVHPLPLLTCEGNGEGGGDYSLENPNIGIWARNLISIESKRPKDYTELIPNFLMNM